MVESRVSKGQVPAAGDYVTLFTVLLAEPTTPKGSQFQHTFLNPEIQSGR